MSNNLTVKVFAPASVANVAVGFDILGFALMGMGDDVLIRKGTKEGLTIKTIHKGKSLSKDPEKNTAGVAALSLLKSLDLLREPLEMEIFKNMSIGTGLGSSAASAVAGALAVNAYLGNPFTKSQLLPFATAGEQLADGAYHADNVAPSLLGSMILVRDNDTLDCIKLPVPIGLRAVIIYPHIEVLTKDSRGVLSPTISLEQHIKQSANLAAFISSLYRSDFSLMQRSLNDIIIEPQRSRLIPGFKEIKNLAINAGALGCSISGAGPSVFCLCNNSIIAENIQDSWTRFYKDKSIEFDCFISDINREGAFVY